MHKSDAFENSAVTEPKEKLIGRLEKNLTDYFDTLRNKDANEIAGMTSEIAAMMQAHYYLTAAHSFNDSELEYFLKFQNPLRVLADELRMNGLEDYSSTIWSIIDSEDALQGDYELMPAAPAQDTRHSPSEKASIMGQIRNAREQSKTNPAPRKESRGKDAGHEL